METPQICSTTIPPNPLSEDCLALVHRWMRRCSKHKKCRTQVPRTLPKRVISVFADNKVYLKHTSSEEQGTYLVLSHCWGKASTKVLTSETIEQLSSNIDIRALPRNFQDAIAVTQKLGIDYVWIDAMCIIQDSRDDWTEQAPQMASIYGNALLTISALESPASSSGFLHHRAISSPCFNLDEKFYLKHMTMPIGTILDDAILNSRGWATQERLMSPRLLHFTREQMAWECAEEFLAERMPSCPLLESGRYGKLEVQEVIFSSQHTHTTDISSGLPGPIQRLDVWRRCVLEYSKRDLTYASDKLPAIASLAEYINDGSLGKYLAGIFERNFVNGLLWREANQAMVFSTNEKRNLINPTKLYRAPSWSWVSCEGPIHMPSDIPDLQQVDSEMWQDWQKQYKPILLEHHVILKDPNRSYMEVVEGSYVILQGYCRFILPLPEGAKPAFEFAEARVLSDEQHGYPCFIPFRHSTKPLGMEKEGDKKPKHLCLQLNGYDDGYDSLVVDALVLEAVNEDEDCWRRIGFMAVKSSTRNWTLNIETLNDIGWDQRILKLV
jgi:hypothetical protein